YQSNVSGRNMKVDLHLHTCYSPDSNSSLESIISRCQKSGISCVAITDHNTIDGALRMREICPFAVIVSEEVMSSAGEIIGYYLTESIPSGLPPSEVMGRIKDQGGLVCLPHPFDGFGRYPLKANEREALLTQIDIIEVFNARSLKSNFSEEARLFAERHGFLQSAGSDAHAPREVGNAYVEMPEFDGPEELKMALAKGKIFGRRNSMKSRVLTAMATMPKRLRCRWNV
ncbi:MAG: PHP domain-containing protein, partial [Chloroflexota bacterium]|nr:PHP domain-containing protein [Chloroflexota bacterium]